MVNVTIYIYTIHGSVMGIGCGDIVSVRFPTPLVDAKRWSKRWRLRLADSRQHGQWVRALQMGLLWADLHGCDDVWCIMQTLVFLPFLAIFHMCGFVLHLLFQDFLTIAIHQTHQILKICVCMCGPPCPSTMHHANCVCCQSHQWPIKNLSGQLQRSEVEFQNMYEFSQGLET